MKKLKLVLIPVVLMLIVVGISAWFLENTKPVTNTANYVNFNVPAGANAAQIGLSLYKKGLIKNPTAFKVYSQFTGVADSIQTGDYRLSPSFNMFQIVGQLAKAPLSVKVTIPEGLRREEVASRFAKNLDQNNSFTTEFFEESRNEEGYLFPDTYFVSNNATPASIIAKMKANFVAKTDSLVSENSALSKSELVILASLIERETRTDEERPIVAGIIMNRLNIGMPLQIDATVQYTIATNKCKFNVLDCTWWEQLNPGELGVSSPYNTYKNQGLPPGAIANPGLSSIKAAYNPAETDYFYYIHDPSGNIHYARTLEEQNENIEKYLR